MEPEKIFAERFSNLIKNSNYTLEEIGEYIGIKSKSTISKYLSGSIKNVKSSVISNIANLFNVSPAWLAGLSDDKYRETRIDKFGNSVISIPLLGTVKAGYNYLAQENWEGTVEIKEELAKTGDFFALKIKGDSMLEVLWENDIVAVKKQNFANTNDIAVVIINGDEATVKKINILENGIMLIPFNSAYSPIFLSKEDIRKKPVEIIGIVKQIIERKF